MLLGFFSPDVSHLMIPCFNAACRVFQDTLKPGLTVTSQSAKNSFFVRLQRQESSISLAEVTMSKESIYVYNTAFLTVLFIKFHCNTLTNMSFLYFNFSLIKFNKRNVLVLIKNIIDWLIELIYKTQMSGSLPTMGFASRHGNKS